MVGMATLATSKSLQSRSEKEGIFFWTVHIAAEAKIDTRKR